MSQTAGPGDPGRRRWEAQPLLSLGVRLLVLAIPLARRDACDRCPEPPRSASRHLPSARGMVASDPGRQHGHGPDGIAVVRGGLDVGGLDLSNNLFVNGNDGTVLRIDTNHGNGVTVVAGGGLRGDFITVGGRRLLLRHPGQQARPPRALRLRAQQPGL